MAESARLVYEFGDFALDRARRLLTSRRDGAAIPLPARVLDTLFCFVERPGQLLGKALLLEAVWPDKHVEENSLARNVSILRRALGDSRFIATDQGRGYRFVADVRLLEDRAAPPPVRIRADTQDLMAQARALSVRPSKQNLLGALEVLERAVVRDSECAAAYTMLARVRSTFLVFDLPVAGGIATIERDARRALELDSRLGDAHAALGLVRAFQGRWIEAEEHFRSAMSLESQPDTPALYVTMVAHSVGHFERALKDMLALHRRSPGDSFFPVCIAIAYAALGDDANARAYVDVARRLGQPRGQAPLQDVEAELALRSVDFELASRLMSEALSPAMRSAGGEQTVSLVFEGLASGSGHEAAIASLHELELRMESFGHVDMKRFLRWYSALGDLDGAFATVNRCLDAFARIGTVGSAWAMLWGPEMRAFRRDPRFEALTARLNFNDYWLRHGRP